MALNKLVDPEELKDLNLIMQYLHRTYERMLNHEERAKVGSKEKVKILLYSLWAKSRGSRFYARYVDFID